MAQRGVIFDMDGVLVASGPAHSASWKIVAQKHGLKISAAQFQATFGQASRDIIRQLWGRPLSDADIRRIDDEKEAVYRDFIRGMVPLTIGARETLQRLREAGLALAVGTSGPPENLHLVLEEGRLASFFQAAVSGFDVQRGKPAPDIFLKAAERVNLAPAECIVVEDAPVGIEAAHAGGMRAIGFIGTHPRERLEAAGADAIVERLAEITPALVNQLLDAAPRH